MAGIARDAQAGRTVGYACFPGREAGSAPPAGRTIALLHWFRRLCIRWEIRDDIHFLGRSLVLEAAAPP